MTIRLRYIEQHSILIDFITITDELKLLSENKVTENFRERSKLFIFVILQGFFKDLLKVVLFIVRCH